MIRSHLALCFLLLGVSPSKAFAETPEEVRARLERGRVLDRQEAIRRQETLEWQQKRKAEEYSRIWKRYGDSFEVNIARWWKQTDGNWITYANYLTDANVEENNSPRVPTEPKATASLSIPDFQSLKPPLRFDQSLEKYVREGVISCSEYSFISQSKSSVASCSKASLIGVSCSSLHVNKKPPFKEWGAWERPRPGSQEEQLLVDRCSHE